MSQIMQMQPFKSGPLTNRLPAFLYVDQVVHRIVGGKERQVRVRADDDATDVVTAERARRVRRDAEHGFRQREPGVARRQRRRCAEIRERAGAGVQIGADGDAHSRQRYLAIERQIVARQPLGSFGSSRLYGRDRRDIVG